jgi:4-hydroxythreonine-4-phosphate dehydrogenase
MIVVSTGCPSGIGPEVSVAAAAKLRTAPCVLVGDEGTLRAAAELVGVAQRRLVAFQGNPPRPGQIAILHQGPRLRPSDRKPGKPSRTAGVAQLVYVCAAYDLAAAARGRVLVTGPVSKAVIARSGAPGADRFLGHTEWLQARDAADASVMCFWSQRLSTSLVTTHLPIADVPRALTPRGVAIATVWLARLLRALGNPRPSLAVSSLNPHAGESKLLGNEEARAIAPGIALATKTLGKQAVLHGPIGAETAFRKAYGGGYDGVVAMYHDQATVPMKLVAFGTAVNVTMGLSVVRTSVDHGTGYDIAWHKQASPAGMVTAIELAQRLMGSRELRVR